MVMDRWDATRAVPGYATRFIGRDSELQTLRHLLSGAPDGSDQSASTSGRRRLLSLVGAGGCGKTRLAAELARSLVPTWIDQNLSVPTPMQWIDLTSASDGASLSSAVASAFHLRELSAHGLRNALRAERHLVVLDNCEQIAGDCAQLLDRLLPACPNLVVVATSRVSLHATSEFVFRVPPLGTTSSPRVGDRHSGRSEATRLFLDRAGMVMPGYELLGEDTQAVEALCQRLDGSPLAIELAASWVRVLSARDLLDEVNRNLDILSSSTTTLVGRHQSLRAVLDSSWQWLDDRERRVLGRLSVFVGGFGREAAVAVTGAPLSTLLSLAEKSLIQRLPGTRAGTRYHLHQVVRDYAMERLAESPLDAEDARSKLLDHLLATIYRADDIWTAERHSVPIDSSTDDRANLISALQWAVERQDSERALRLSATLLGFWLYASPVSAYTSAVEGALKLPWNAASASTTRARAMTLCVAGYGAVWASDYPRAAQGFADAVALYRGVDDELAVAWSLQGWSYALTLAGAPAEGQQLEEQGLEIVQRLGDQRGLAWASHDLGEIAFARGDLDRAEHFLAEGCRRFADLGLTYGRYRAESMLADVYRLKAEWALAVTWYERSLALLPHAPTGGAEILEGLAQIAEAMREPALAARLFGCGHAWRQTYGLARFYFYETEHSRSLTRAQEQLSPEEWRTNYVAGWQLRPEQAMEEARRAGTELAEAAAVHAASGLTRRQREIVTLVAEGLSNADIAARLVVSHRTVDAHLRSIFEKLGVATRIAAVHEAERRHLIKL